jgi:RecB family exonuclease
MTKHLPIGGSSAQRTLACPAWLKRRDFHKPSNRSNTAADEGNLLHTAMENYYLNGQTFVDQIGVTTYADQVLQKEHYPLLESARQQVEKVLDDYQLNEFYCEPFVQYEKDRIGGSIDMLALSDCRTVGAIIDYKFGATKVSAQDNAQMKFYAMSATHDEKMAQAVKGVSLWVLVIVQPKCTDTPDIFECTDYDIALFEQALLSALDTPDKAQTGSHCKYCPVAPYCPDKKAEALKALTLSKTSATSLGQSWQIAQDLKAWIKEVEAECNEKLSQGASIPDLKLVAGRKTRTWAADSDTLVSNFGPDILETAPLSPAKAEKVYGKKAVAEFVQSTPGKPSVVHVTDKREGLEINIEEKLKGKLATKSKLF